MSDPAVEAATRAMKATHGWPEPNYDLVAAASEALKPIRDLHFRADVYNRAICNEDGYDWPCNTAKLVYSAEELAGVSLHTHGKSEQ